MSSFSESGGGGSDASTKGSHSGGETRAAVDLQSGATRVNRQPLPKKKRPEFQAVIMGGTGSSMATLTNGYTKPLLPILNRPMLSYQLSLLQKSNFSEAILVVDGFDGDQRLTNTIREFIKEYNAKHKLQVHVEVMTEALGTAEVLRKIAHLIVTNFIVLPCDLVCECPMSAIADVFRATDSSCTMLLVEPSKVALSVRGAAPVRRHMKKKQQIFGMTPISASGGPGGRSSQQHRVLFTSSREELESAEDETAHKLVIPKALLVNQPNVLVRADLNSSHVFVFAHWVLKLLEAKEYLISIRADLVPYLMRAQYRSKEALPADIHANLLADCSKNFLAMALDGKDDDGQGGTKDILRVTSLTISPDVFFCARARNFQSVLEINQKLLVHNHKECTPWSPITNFRVKRQNVQLENSIVGQNTHIAPGSKLKNCVIGSNVKIGTKANIIKSVILDGAEVGNNCTVQDSFIGQQAEIGDKCSVKECQLGSEASLANGSAVKAQEIVKDLTN